MRIGHSVWTLPFWLVACASSSSPAASPPSPTFDDLIVLGTRIGPVSVGMTDGQLLKALGLPDQTYGAALAPIYVYNRLGIEVGMFRGRVEKVMTSDRRYVTTGGVRVGSQLMEVSAEMGQPKWQKMNPGDKSAMLCYAAGDGTEVIVGVNPAPDAGRVREIDVTGCEL